MQVGLTGRPAIHTAKLFAPCRQHIRDSRLHAEKPEGSPEPSKPVSTKEGKKEVTKEGNKGGDSKEDEKKGGAVAKVCPSYLLRCCSCQCKIIRIRTSPSDTHAGRQDQGYTVLCV